MVQMLVPLQKFAFHCFYDKQLKGGKYMHRIMNVMYLLHHYIDHCSTFWTTVLIIYFFNSCSIFNSRKYLVIWTTVGTWWQLLVKLSSSKPNVSPWNCTEIIQSLLTQQQYSYINSNRTYCSRLHWFTKRNRMSCLTTNANSFSGLKLFYADG
jgi:hypothetical protein